MKIAHLSDLHISYRNRPMNLKFARRLIEYALEEGVDHFVITGDITHFGEPDDFIALRKLFEEYGLLNPFKLSLVIGNHDIYGGVHFAEDILTFPIKCTKLSYQHKLEEFKSYFLETFENLYAPPPPKVFPYLKPLGDVIFIGINSIAKYSKLGNIFASRGRVYKDQLRDLENLLSLKAYQAKKRIALIHHHFNRQISSHFTENQSLLKKIERHANRLANKKNLIRLFKKYDIDLILHGHEHNSCEYFIDGIKFMNAGGALERNIGDQFRINFISIYGDDMYTEVRIVKKAELEDKKKLFADTLILNSSLS